MGRTSNAHRCNHCGRPGRLRMSKTDPDNELCSKCWERFGGGRAVANRTAGQRRARRPRLG